MTIFNRETVFVERRQPQLRWSAIFAGAAISIGVWTLLQVWGIGIDLASIDPSHETDLRGASIGAGFISLIAPILAVFVAGIFSGWLANTVERGLGAVHALVVWALTVLAAGAAMMSFVPMIAMPSTGSTDHLRFAIHAGHALMWIGGSLVISLVAALLGGALGVMRMRRRQPPVAVRTTAPSEIVVPTDV
ncbi:MAG TPA: hypothetical protein VGG74_19650 [Kofleriaceae bacterium]|jgi:hypothetical protein